MQLLQKRNQNNKILAKIVGRYSA